MFTAIRPPHCPKRYGEDFELLFSASHSEEQLALLLLALEKNSATYQSGRKQMLQAEF